MGEGCLKSTRKKPITLSETATRVPKITFVNVSPVDAVVLSRAEEIIINAERPFYILKH